MANRIRKVAMAAAIVGAVLAPRVASAAEGTSPALLADPGAHLRPTTLALASLVERATRESSTFSEIVRTIEDSDTYVYVMEGECGHGVRACFTGVTIAGARRIMRVTVSLDSSQPDWYVIGSIGHELHHTVEAINDPTVRSTAAQYFLYERIGFKGTAHSHETRAAMDAGNAVRAEIRRFARSGKSE
ncbi:MAG TPA: hypothetical protein VN654_24545 [Vicinamibacterales bacterium]|jgi:hypothetical protein|nr:hypothetical protein [Vicinamibacterales bacterium]